MLIVTVVALAWANSPLGDTYTGLWQTELTIRLGTFSLAKDPLFWINEDKSVWYALLMLGTLPSCSLRTPFRTVSL